MYEYDERAPDDGDMRYCSVCDAWFDGDECPDCMETDRAERPEREDDDDDV